MMRKIGSLIGALTLLASARVWAQDVLLYSKILTNPYCDVTATLELWGDADGSVQEYVNYLMYADNPAEENVIRVNVDERLKIVWRLSGTASVPTLREVYKNITGLDEAAISETPLTGQAVVTGADQTKVLETGTAAKSQELVLEASGTGVQWAEYALSYNVEEFLAFDEAGKLRTDFGTPLVKKKIQIQWIRGDIESLSVSPFESGVGALRALITTVGGRSSDRPAWRTINLWEDDIALPLDRLSLLLLDEGYGIRKEQIGWIVGYGKRYQLQVVDWLGRSISVFYPNVTQ